MKLFRILTTCSFLRRLSVAAAALLVSIGAAKAAGTNYSATILADNPVAYWRLDEYLCRWTFGTDGEPAGEQRPCFAPLVEKGTKRPDPDGQTG